MQHVTLRRGITSASLKLGSDNIFIEETTGNMLEKINVTAKADTVLRAVYVSV